MPAPEAPQQHDSKTKLLEAAMNVFREKGYTATTVDDVCRAAGLTKGSFFHHFKSKEELALAAADHFGAMATGFFKTAPYHAHSDPLERVLGYIDFRAAIIVGEVPEFTCYFGTMVQEIFVTHPAIREACERHMNGHIAEVSKDIVEAKQRHAPHAPWSPESVSVFLQSGLQGAFVLAKAQNSPLVAVECIKHLREYVELLFASSIKKEAAL